MIKELENACLEDDWCEKHVYCLSAQEMGPESNALTCAAVILNRTLPLSPQASYEKDDWCEKHVYCSSAQEMGPEQRPYMCSSVFKQDTASVSAGKL